MLKLLILLLVAAAAQAAPKTRGYSGPPEARAAALELAKLDTAARKQLFEQWKLEHGKGPDASLVGWLANLQDMIAHNSRTDVTYSKGLHEYSDIPFADFAAKRLMKGMDISRLNPLARAAVGGVAAKTAAAPRASRKLTQAVPQEWDWRTLGKVTPVKNQGNCGSCWAFAAIAALESKAAIDNVAPSADLSEQQMVDCVNYSGPISFWSAGCNGGYSDEVFRLVSFVDKWGQPYHATTEQDYHYTATTGTCQQGPGAGVAGSVRLVAPASGYTLVAAGKQAIAAAISSTGPVVIYFNVVGSFYGYSTGVYPAAGCPTDTINHAMVVVGYNFNAPTPYWIVRNSWGSGWGASGYILVEATDDTVGACRMQAFAMLPGTTADASGSTPTPSPSPSPSPSPKPPKPCKGRKCY